MTSVTMPLPEAIAVVASDLRRPDRNLGLPAAHERTLEWDADLSVAEAALLDSIRATARSRVPGITPAEWEALGPHLATIRALQQMSRADFMALTATERDRLTFDNLTAIIRVLRAFLRD